jgi:hypothetical protein
MTAKTHAHRWQQLLRIGDGNNTASCEAMTHQEAEGGDGGASSSSSDAASFPPRRDGGAPREIPSNGGGSDVSRVNREFDIGKIGVVNDPVTETGAAAMAAAAAGNRGGRQQSTTSGSTSILHEIIIM